MQKNWVSARLSRYLIDAQKSIIFKSVIKFQFSYCPIVWMFFSRQTNNIIYKLHKRSLKIVLNDQTSNFKMLLVQSSDICNDQRNIPTLMTEAYKIQNNPVPLTMETMLGRKTIPYNLRNPQEVTQRNRAVNYGLESFSN